MSFDARTRSGKAGDERALRGDERRRCARTRRRRTTRSAVRCSRSCRSGQRSRRRPARSRPTMRAARVVHYEHDILVHRPLEAGMTVVSRATPVALLAAPNGTSLVIRTETRTDDGELVNEQYVTEFFRGVEAEQSGRRARARPPARGRRRAARGGRASDRRRPDGALRRGVGRRLRDPPRRRVRAARRACPAGSCTASARWRSRAAPCSRPPASTTRARSGGSRCASRRRSSRARR